MPKPTPMNSRQLFQNPISCNYSTQVFLKLHLSESARRRELWLCKKFLPECLKPVLLAFGTVLVLYFKKAKCYKPAMLLRVPYDGYFNAV